MILITEDAADVLDIHHEVISACFQDSVVTAQSAKEGVRLAQTHGEHIRLLVTDYDLGDGTGFEVAQALKEAGSEAVCILITGNPQWVLPHERELFQEIAAKPLSLKQLETLLERIPGYYSAPNS